MKKPHPLTPSIQTPSGYAEFLTELKHRIRSAQLKAAVSVNRELVLLYWDIGRQIVERQDREKWGTHVISRLAQDLKKEFPGVGGFSEGNLRRIRAFYLAYSQGFPIHAQAVRELGLPKLLPLLSTVPWGHNVLLVEKVKNSIERLWYAQKTIENGWSRSVLWHQIDTKLYHRQGKSKKIANFPKVLPPAQSDLALEMMKDPYNFDFLTLAEEAHELDLERGLLEHIREFLIELGKGFSFVGNQHHLVVGNEDFYLDLLFYHLRLRCYIVIELKMTEFKPEYAGKMNFYLSAVDDLLRQPGDNPSIGIILCKVRNRVVAEYALKDTHKPIGVAAYRLTEKLPQPLKGQLPTTEQLEKELSEKSRSGAGRQGDKTN